VATNFPTSLDTLTNPTSSDSLNSPSHSAQHANVNDAVEALQVKVGIDSSADTSSLEYRIAQLEAAGSPIVKVAAFTSSGTWTVPSGVTYAVAHILGGGGGGGTRDNNGSAGGDSSVAFAGGTVTAGGGAGAPATGSQGASGLASSPANSGIGGISNSGGGGGKDGALIVAGDTVTPGASITVTVGAGGADGGGPYNPGGDGGSGYVWIEYQES
jgi:hypothetical protein